MDLGQLVSNLNMGKYTSNVQFFRDVSLSVLCPFDTKTNFLDQPTDIIDAKQRQFLQQNQLTRVQSGSYFEKVFRSTSQG